MLSKNRREKKQLLSAQPRTRFQVATENDVGRRFISHSRSQGSRRVLNPIGAIRVDPQLFMPHLRSLSLPVGFFFFFLSLSARPFSFISICFVVFLLAFIIGSRYACVRAAAVLSWCVLLQLSLLLRGGRVLSRSIIRGCTQQRVSAEIEDAA